MPRRLARFIAQKIVHPVLMAYLDIYTDDDEPEADSGTPLRADPHSTVIGQYEVAANRDHTTMELTAKHRPFGFGSGRAHDRTSD